MNARPVIARSPRGDLVVADLRYARSPLPRMRGLLGMSELPAGRGLWIEPAPAVHTAFMRFAIDVVFLDREWCVVRIASDMPPWRAVAAKHARVALELPAGAAAAAGLVVGDTLHVTDGEGAHAC